MTSIIRLIALSGAQGESPPAYILQIDDFRFLLDAGWDELLTDQALERVAKYADKIDGVLLSHSDPFHLGALPCLVKCGLKCPVYATFPIWQMGQMFMYDCYLNQHNSREFKLFDLDDVDSAFERIEQVQFGQVIQLKGKGHGISITALPAGHSLGGSCWKISKVGEEDIYYAIDHNNKKERHLNGCEVTTTRPPGVFITNALNALYVQEKRRKRDELLMSVLMHSLRMGGNVLIATDTAGRSLELILMLDQMWRMKDSGLAPFSLVFLNNVAFNVLEFAKQQTKWMSEKLQKSYESSGQNPYNLRHVKVCHTLAELSQIPSPKVVVTSSADLESGFTRDLFIQWCQDPQNCVVLTCRTSPGTLARQLIEDRSQAKCLTLEVRQKVKLEGRELDEFLNAGKNVAMSDSEEEDDEVETFIPAGQQRMNGTGFSGVFVNGTKNNNNNNNSSNNVGKMVNGKGRGQQQEDGFTRKRKFEGRQILDGEEFKENSTSNSTKRSKSVVEGKRVHQRKSESGEGGAGSDEPPVKFLCTKQTIVVNCMVHYIDFEGRSDVEAVLKMLQELQPQKLVIVRGTPQATSTLQAMCQSLLPNTKIFQPAIDQVVDLTTGNQLLQVTLADSLTSTLQLEKLRGMELAWVDGQIRVDQKTESNNSFRSSSSEICSSRRNKPVLFDSPVLEPLSRKSVSRPGNALFVNRLRLSEFKQILAKNGIESEYSGGVLRVKGSNGVVYIQRHSESKELVVECDGLTDEFYTVRRLLYQQFAILDTNSSS